MLWFAISPGVARWEGPAAAPAEPEPEDAEPEPEAAEPELEVTEPEPEAAEPEPEAAEAEPKEPQLSEPDAEDRVNSSGTPSATSPFVVVTTPTVASRRSARSSANW